ncbi:MAG: GNAT family N-acetyltransferase [Clostridia bacterium]|nr:GNAT family N-acetyltransferase [Clostridia bacterium]
MVYELKEPSKVAGLFEGIEDTGVYSCLQGVMGKVYVTDEANPRSAMALCGAFAFYAGEPDKELVVNKPEGYIIMVPQNDGWAKLIEDNFPAYKRIRYAIKKGAKFDRAKLEAMVEALPEGYELRRIDSELYDICRADPELEDYVCVFETKEKFFELGRGFVVFKDGKIVSGASSYSRYNEGIEIECGTAKEERHKGLGSAVCAKLILSCLDDGLYPSWDAANMMSVRLAEKLGYTFSHEYICFGVE